MRVMTFAAIDIGSYETGMKIFELSSKNGLKEITHLRYRLELGKDAFSKKKIGYELVDKLCSILEDFTKIMKEYQTDAYRACATSAIREVKNTLIILDQIKIRTGINVEVLSNSEQRFLGYKSIASTWNEFDKIIQKATAIVDVGGGSIQISVFDKERLVTTQNIRLGTVRIREKLAALEKRTIHYGELVEELIDHEFHNFKKLYLKEQNIKNIIITGEFIMNLFRGSEKASVLNMITKEGFNELFSKISATVPEKMAEKMGIPLELSGLIMPLSIIYKHLIEMTGAEYVWAPGRNISDGIAYEYGENIGVIKYPHNFEDDILAAARNISKRYMANKNHIDALESLATVIFDSMKKVHGLGKRERLLLQISVMLHDCGKYISMAMAAQCSYNIIMSTEIIGLSHKEREMVANIVKYNTEEFVYYDEMVKTPTLGIDSYLIITKLTAILRLANVMDRSHKQKFKNAKAVIKDKELVITTVTNEDITLEKGLFPEKADFFEEVYSIRPVIKQKIETGKI